MNNTESTTPILRERMVGDVIILSVERELKGEGEQLLRKRLDELVRRGHLDILIDLEDVPYMDSANLGRLIRSHLSVRQAGGRVRLYNLTQRVAKLMKLTRLDTVLDIYTTEEEALAALRRHNAERDGGTPSADTVL